MRLCLDEHVLELMFKSLLQGLFDWQRYLCGLVLVQLDFAIVERALLVAQSPDRVGLQRASKSCYST